ncbi:hypothetical protein [Runella sp.]|uniref:hypothetical protein n=1 Tax=Runella sp. TaxID=1960881 RepID=UPI003D0E5968
MNAVAANAVITPASDTPSAPSFPELVPLSSKEMKKLKRNALWARIVWTTASLSLLLFGIGNWYDRLQKITYGTMTSEEKSLLVFTMTGSVLICLIYIFIARYHIRKNSIDIKNATKQVGMIKVISKEFVYHREASDAYFVFFKWLSDPKSELIQWDDSGMYHQLREGDTAYVELVPHSQSVLVCKKIQEAQPTEESVKRGYYF